MSIIIAVNIAGFQFITLFNEFRDCYRLGRRSCDKLSTIYFYNSTLQSNSIIQTHNPNL